MRRAERRCEACGELAGGDPSAHFARVVWLCELHSAEFHQAELLAVFRAASSTAECWSAIDCWLRTACTLLLAERRLRLVPTVPDWERLAQ